MQLAPINWQTTPAAIWRSNRQQLKAVNQVKGLSLERLLGIASQKEALIANTERFLAGKPSNHVLLWGSRGTGKSSLIKALLLEYEAQGLRVIQLAKEDLHWLPELSDELSQEDFKFIIFCDDLSFEDGETSYKGLKSILEGSIETPPANIKVYATSNRRHLVPEYTEDNQHASYGTGGELHLGDRVEERMSLADRFGLSLSFYQGNLEDYLALVKSYFAHQLASEIPPELDEKELLAAAVMFAKQRASYSGRTAQQFFNAYSVSS